jgi:FMN hydrolase / 5-amino-6-(5-phospho-D-ribitylamino)uracil phosphatase
MTRDARVLLADIMDTVVVDPFFHAGIEDFFGLTARELYKAIRPGVWLQFERGELDEQAYYTQFFADGRGVDGAALVAWMRPRYRFVDGMEALLAEANGAGIEVHALSNYPVWWRVIEDELCLSRYLQWRFVSCMTGVRKPDPGAYTGPLETLGVAAEQCLFTDDRAANVAAAEALGMHGHTFADADGLRIKMVQLGWLCEARPNAR